MLANAPLFMLGVFLVLNSIGLPEPGKARMGNQYHFVVDSANLHPAFYPWLKFSIGFCIFTLVFLLILRKDFSHEMALANGTIFAFISFTTLLFYSTYGALYLSEGFNPQIESLMTAFYFSIETIQPAMAILSCF